MPSIYHALMHVELPADMPMRCCICGRAWPLNMHHVVWRSWGQLVEGGKVLEKPCVPLCGSGNASGCHGMAHSRLLHFRAHGTRLQFLVTLEPTAYADALGMEGWRDVFPDAL